MVNKITQKFVNFINDKKFSSTTADSEWCDAFNASLIKNVKEANVPLKLLPICREYVNVLSRFG